MNKQEAAFSIKFRLWAKKHLGTSAIEVKHTRGSDKFRCSELKEHQYWSLKAANEKSGLAYKVPDDGMGSKPFDMIVLKRVSAYVVISFPQGVALIPVENWNLELKSIDLDQASMMGTIISI